jgi:gluconate 5-dehydrogenase
MPQPLFSLDGKLALVTGAARGLGLAMARSLALAGAEVLLNGRDEGRLRPGVEALQAEGLKAAGLVFDVADDAAVERALAAIEREHGHLDIFVSNVGLRNRQPIDQLSGADMREMLDTNLTAPFVLAKRAAALMLPRRWGRLIMVTSVAGSLARAGDAAYAASKGGLTALTRALAAEYGPHGITANAIAPGFFATETNAARVADPKVRSMVEMRVPLRRWGEPREIGAAAVFLAAEEASYVNGHVLTVDGGLSASL